MRYSERYKDRKYLPTAHCLFSYVQVSQRDIYAFYLCFLNYALIHLCLHQGLLSCRQTIAHSALIEPLVWWQVWMLSSFILNDLAFLVFLLLAIHSLSLRWAFSSANNFWTYSRIYIYISSDDAYNSWFFGTVAL